MTELSDHELLRRFCTVRDRAALNELAGRHIGMVYAAARRQVGDAELAEDVTQAVFIVLVRQAASIRPGVELCSWLHTVTRHASANARRMRSRRVHHETHKALMSTEQYNPADSNDQIDPLLDSAITSLGSTERSGVLLHFFQNLTHKEIGARLGMTEEASRKRVARALDKMRAFFQKRGVVTGASAIAATLSAQGNSVAAPIGLLESVVNVAVLTNTVGVGSSGALFIA
ncbi:MAG: RNA polymerase sigma factor, partial [Tepidisphaeraceae bacterium]